MSRVSIQPQAVPAASQPLLDQIQQAFGATPNMFKAVSNSPAALQSMWGFFGALGKGTLDLVTEGVGSSSMGEPTPLRIWLTFSRMQGLVEGSAEDLNNKK